MGKVVVWLATGCGVGWFPVAPGTIGTLWGIPLALGLDALGSPLGWGGIVWLLLLPPSAAICGRAARLLQREDPGCVVLDEIIAYPLALAAVPITPLNLALAFFAFRLFDVTKPWPIRRFERLPGGVGILADDLVAGAMAGTVVWGVDRLLS